MVSAEAYGLIGLASGVVCVALFVIALCRAAAECKWERVSWENERHAAGDEITRAEAQVRCRCLPDPLEALWHTPPVEPEGTVR